MTRGRRKILLGDFAVMCCRCTPALFAMHLVLECLQLVKVHEVALQVSRCENGAR